MITGDFSFVDADLSVVSASIINLMKQKRPVKQWTDPLYIDLKYDCNHARIAKMVLWSPSPGKTAIYGNASDGFSVLFSTLNIRYGYNITQISLTLDLDNKINDSDIYLFRLFDFLGSNGTERMVRVMQEPHWDFYEIGEPFPFEQTEKYKERIKKKRLTNDMILDYAEAMGYDVRNPEFWKSDNATYLEWSWIPVTKQNKP